MKPNLFPACGDDANGFRGLAFFAKNFVKVQGPNNTLLRLPDRDVQQLGWIEKMSKTHTPKIIKLRGGGIKTIWVLK